MVHQPKRLQSKFEEAFSIIEGAGDKIKAYIQQKMYDLSLSLLTHFIFDIPSLSVTVLLVIEHLRILLIMANQMLLFTTMSIMFVIPRALIIFAIVF